jgi:hypothetical protein
MLSGERIFVVLDSDAATESLPHSTLADIYMVRIQEAITRYRKDRAPEVLIKRAALALGQQCLISPDRTRHRSCIPVHPWIRLAGLQRC